MKKLFSLLFFLLSTSVYFAMPAEAKPVNIDLETQTNPKLEEQAIAEVISEAVETSPKAQEMQKSGVCISEIKQIIASFLVTCNRGTLIAANLSLALIALASIGYLNALLVPIVATKLIAFVSGSALYVKTLLVAWQVASSLAASAALIFTASFAGVVGAIALLLDLKLSAFAIGSAVPFIQDKIIKIGMAFEKFALAKLGCRIVDNKEK